MGTGASCTVLKRNGVDKFLTACAANFETYVFTAGTKDYADPLLDSLDPERRLAGRLYRCDCHPCRGPEGQEMYLKDLTAVARRGGRADNDMARIVLVDNNPASFVFQPRNGILVPDFCGERDDVLPAVLQLLQKLNRDAADVRPVLDKMFGLEECLAGVRSVLSGEQQNCARSGPPSSCL
jgi:CTD small phosphatase-like protein 2